jgi:hypothetical protein
MSEVEFIPPTPPNTFQALATAVDQLIGAALCSSGGATPLETKPAKADAFATSLVVGLATRPALNVGDQQYPRYIGELTLTTAEWTAVTEEAGALVEGDAYYVSAANAGKITHTAPVAAGSFVAQVGIALSPHTLLVQISAPVGPHA